MMKLFMIDNRQGYVYDSQGVVCQFVASSDHEKVVLAREWYPHEDAEGLEISLKDFVEMFSMKGGHIQALLTEVK